MVTSQREGCLYLLVASPTHGGCFIDLHFQVWSGVYRVALGAGDVVDIVCTRTPVVEIECCVARVEFYADERLSRSTEIL